MEKEEKDILDSALGDFEEEVKSEETKKPESVQEVINDLKHEMQDEPENFEVLENLMKNLADELENNDELKEGLEDLGNQFFQGGVLEESMKELRDKLKKYRNQLAVYEQICELLRQGRDDDAMALVGKLSLYGEMPEELLPPVPQDCVVV